MDVEQVLSAYTHCVLKNSDKDCEGCPYFEFEKGVCKDHLLWDMCRAINNKGIIVNTPAEQKKNAEMVLNDLRTKVSSEAAYARRMRGQAKNKDRNGTSAFYLGHTIAFDKVIAIIDDMRSKQK